MLRNQLLAMRTEVGYGPSATYLDYLIERLDALESSTSVTFDLFCSPPQRAQFAACFSSQADLPFKVRVISSLSAVRCCRLFDSAPLAAYVDVEAEGTQEELATARDYLASPAHAYQKVWFFTVRNAKTGDASESRGLAGDDKEHDIKVADSSQIVEHLSDMVRREGLALQSKHLDRIHQAAVATLKAIVSEEGKSLAQRKAVLSSRLEKTRGPATAAGGADLATQLKNMMQKNLQDIDRVFRLKYEELSRPNVGQFPKFVESEADKLGDDHIHRVELAVKFETFETHIADEFTASMCSNLRRRFEAEAEKDLAYIGGLIDEVRSGLQATLSRNGYAPDVIERVTIPDPDPSRLGSAYFVLSKKYKGEVTKPGFIEYFQALRDYTGMIMVVVGIVAPLTLIATAPDAEPGSMLAKIDEFAKDMKNIRAYVTAVTAGLVAFMVIYGVYDLRRRIPLKRLQEQAKEVRLAKEFMAEQGVRMFNDAQRDWVATIGQYVRDFVSLMNSELEGLVRSVQSGSSEKAMQTREEIERERISLDHKLKNFSQVERIIESMGRLMGEAGDAMGSRPRISSRSI